MTHNVLRTKYWVCFEKIITKVDKGLNIIGFILELGEQFICKADPFLYISLFDLLQFLLTLGEELPGRQLLRLFFHTFCLNFFFFIDSDSLTENQYNDLEFRLNKLDSLNTEYDKFQTELELLSEDSTQLFQEREEFDTKYFSLVGSARAFECPCWSIRIKLTFVTFTSVQASLVIVGESEF
ncbi:unnamed protein product [Leptidea sinapis]|uniref:Uncharacterized protein n=1 Tax=Leptidea sinapis TaxID=189913 RepID=A0A5E4R164_9NEOP|nr:unnamed protein product [Leptidea sinapis]